MQGCTKTWHPLTRFTGKTFKRCNQWRLHKSNIITEWRGTRALNSKQQALCATRHTAFPSCHVVQIAKHATRLPHMPKQLGVHTITNPQMTQIAKLKELKAIITVATLKCTLIISTLSGTHPLHTKQIYDHNQAK